VPAIRISSSYYSWPQSFQPATGLRGSLKILWQSARVEQNMVFGCALEQFRTFRDQNPFRSRKRRARECAWYHWIEFDGGETVVWHYLLDYSFTLLYVPHGVCQWIQLGISLKVILHSWHQQWLQHAYWFGASCMFWTFRSIVIASFGRNFSEFVGRCGQSFKGSNTFP